MDILITWAILTIGCLLFVGLSGLVWVIILNKANDKQAVELKDMLEEISSKIKQEDQE